MTQTVKLIANLLQKQKNNKINCLNIYKICLNENHLVYNKNSYE